jgi:hypothetical protein
VLPLLAERVRQTRKPPYAHSHREVLPLHVRCADSFLIWVSVNRRGDRFSQARRTIPACVLRRVLCVDLDELRVVHAVTKDVAHGVGISVQAIRCELESLFLVRGFRQFRYKPRCGGNGALAEFERENEFCMPLDGNEGPCVARLVGVAVALVSFFFPDVAPDLITLDITDSDSAKLGGHQCFAAFASDNQKPHNRVTVQASDTLCRPDAVSFNQEPQRQQAALFVNLLVAEHAKLLVFAERFTALRTAVALKPI